VNFFGLRKDLTARLRRAKTLPGLPPPEGGGGQEPGHHPWLSPQRPQYGQSQS
jgi:hypothetical protein